MNNTTTSTTSTHTCVHEEYTYKDTHIGRQAVLISAYEHQYRDYLILGTLRDLGRLRVGNRTLVERHEVLKDSPKRSGTCKSIL